jgi:hypothetical protein
MFRRGKGFIGHLQKMSRFLIILQRVNNLLSHFARELTRDECRQSVIVNWSPVFCHDGIPVMWLW